MTESKHEKMLNFSSHEIYIKPNHELLLFTLSVTKVKIVTTLHAGEMGSLTLHV